MWLEMREGWDPLREMRDVIRMILIDFISSESFTFV